MSNNKMLITYLRLNEQEKQERFLPSCASDMLKNKRFALGSAHIVVLEENGAVTAYGDNGMGQCDVSGWDNVTKVAAGDFHTVALKNDGTVLAAGDNKFGQCSVGDWNGIKDIFAEKNLTVGIRENGEMLVASGKPEAEKPDESADEQNQITNDELADKICERLEKLLHEYEGAHERDYDRIAECVEQTLKNYLFRNNFSSQPAASKPTPTRIVAQYRAVPGQSPPPKTAQSKSNGKGSYSTPAEDFEFQITDNSVKIQRYIGSSGNVVVPEMIDGKPVETIDVRAFEKNTALEHVTLPRTLIMIGGYAFRNCTRLRRLEIPSDGKLKSIGECAFEKCQSLRGMINEKKQGVSGASRRS